MSEIDSDDLADDPQRTLIPPSNKELASIIGAEANYDRWSNFVFPHTKSRDLYERRKHEWEVKLPDGERSNARIEVIPAKDERCYTSKSYDVFLALVILWKEQGMGDEKMEIHLSDIAKKLDLKPSGYALNQILEELNCLYFTTISWFFSFNTPGYEKETLKNQRVLDTFEYSRIKERTKGSNKQTLCVVRLSEHIRENLKNRVTIPVNFAARKSIKSDIAKTMYSRIDNILSKSKAYERKGLNIVNEYNLTKHRYKYKSQRKQLLTVLQRNLDGVETSREGVFLSVEIEETADKKDWKCIFTTKGKNNRTSSKKNGRKIVNKNEELRNYLIDSINDTIGGKEENYGLYNTFALYYSETMIFRAIGEFKELVALSPNIKNKKSYFTSIMHTIAHKLGHDWIKECDKNCHYRVENQLFPDG